MTTWPDGAALWLDMNRRGWFAFYAAFLCAFRQSRFTANCAHCGKRESAARHGRWDRFAASQGWKPEEFHWARSSSGMTDETSGLEAEVKQ